jgi:hypothetical protein
LFLDQLKRFEAGLYHEERAKSKKNIPPSWISMYNFASLPNIPDILELYSPVHGIWEGSFHGEASISKAKQEIKHAF